MTLRETRLWRKGRLPLIGAVITLTILAVLGGALYGMDKWTQPEQHALPDNAEMTTTREMQTAERATDEPSQNPVADVTQQRPQPLSLKATPSAPRPVQQKTGDPRFGLNAGGYDGIWPDDFRRAASIGAGVVRLGISWDHVEYQCGVQDFSGFDKELAAAEASGLRVIVIVSGSSTCSCSRGSSVDPSVCPPRPETYRDVLKALAKRYGTRVMAWEIWNEPEQPSYWLGAPDPAAYARLLDAAYQGAKAGNKNAVVLFAATGYIQYDYVEKVLQHLAGKRAFDAVAVHPYRFPAGPKETIENILPGEQTTLKDELVRLTDLFERYGYGRPDLYITELGWGSNHASADPELNTLADQAQHVYDTIKLVQNDPAFRNVKAVTFFIERDSESVEDEKWSYFGLFDKAGKPKPAAIMFRKAVWGK